MDEDFLILIENLSLSVPTDSESPAKMNVAASRNEDLGVDL